MTHTPACRELRREIGVYLLGAIAPTDRRTVESHLAACASCRHQLASLAGLPGLLRRVPVDEVESGLSAGGADGSTRRGRPLGSLLIQAANRRRYRVWSGLAAVAAAGMAAGAAMAYLAAETAPQRPASVSVPGAVTVRGANPRDHTSAVVTYNGLPRGIQLYVQVNGIPAGTKCVVAVTDSRGQESEAGSFTVAAGSADAWYAAASSVPVSDVRGFVVTAGARLLWVAVPFAPSWTDGP